MQHSKTSAGLSDEEREQRVRELMQTHGFSREKAEFIVALGTGESQGDLVDLDEEGDNAEK